jgi:plastocyanin
MLPGRAVPVRSREVVDSHTRMEHAVKLRHLTTSVAAAVTVAALVAGCGSSENSQSAQGASKQSPSSPAKSSRSSQSAPSGGTRPVAIDNFKFTPASLTVSQGARITVTNRDSTAHTMTADNGSFDTGDIDPSSSATITLSKPGTIKYHCSIHPFMHGTLVVN